MLSWKNTGENGEDEADNLMHFCFALDCAIRNGTDPFSSIFQFGFMAGELTLGRCRHR